MQYRTLPPNLEDWLNPIDLFQDRSLLKSIDLELSRRCNQQCKYCFTDAGEALPNELNLTEIKNIISQGREMDIKQVVIVGGGEPLLHNDLKEIIDFILNNKLKILLLTNGTLIDEKKAEYFYNRKVYLCVKLNAFENAQIHDYLVGQSGGFIKVRRVLDMLIDMGYSNPEEPMLAIESIICKKNIGEIPKMWHWARNNNIFPFIELITPQGRARKNQHLFVSRHEAFKLFSELSRIDKNEYGYDWIPIPPIAGFPCRRHYYSCYITSVGEVLPCSGIDISIGNISKNRLQDILENSALIKKLRHIELYLEGKCARCELKNECYGCRGKAFWINGSPFTEDPLCWYKGESNLKIQEIIRNEVKK